MKITLSKTIFILCVLLLGACLRADDKIAVTIVPSSSTEIPNANTAKYAPASISYNGNFYIVISNKSTDPVRLWKGWCSWGYYNLAFDIKLNDGKVYHLEKTENMEWSKNYPDYYIVSPNSYFVIPVNFSKELWAGGSKEWESFPDEVKNGDTILLKAIYSIPEDRETTKYKTWTGKAESEWLHVTFFR